jgi:hypothetical protein
MPDSSEAIDEDAIAAEYKALVSQVKAMTETITTITGSAPADLPELKVIAGVRKSGASGQSGIRRPRFASVEARKSGEDKYTLIQVDKKDAEGKVIGKTSNLTGLANWINAKHKGAGVTAKDFQKVIFEAAGTEDLGTKAGQEIAFSYNVADTNYEIRVIPQEA